MRNGDYTPTRLDAQYDAGLFYHQSNITSDVNNSLYFYLQQVLFVMTGQLLILKIQLELFLWLDKGMFYSFMTVIRYYALYVTDYVELSY